MNTKPATKPVLILLGSQNDEQRIAGLFETLKQFEVAYDLVVSSAHRKPKQTAEIAEEAKAKGYEVIIAAAGLAAHLPGVVASHTTLPVIGLPIAIPPLQGIDALMSILQMPSGVPVACVGLHDGGPKNAALLAIQILARKFPQYEKQLEEYKKNLGR